MSSAPVPSPAPAPPALAAFLRGVERRGAVLAELQTGDINVGDAALASAMRRFHGQAHGPTRDRALLLVDWPVRFWSTLLAEPGLRHRTALALPLDATDNLAALGSGPRIALLLRLAAGLSEADAAMVLGVAVPTYRLALQRALPHHPDGRADPQAWQRLREQVHRRIKTLPAARLQRLTRAREAILTGAVDPHPARFAAAPARPRGLLTALSGLLGLCVLAFAATFWAPVRGLLDDGDDTDLSVRIQPLPASPPASRYGADAALVSHRDHALLSDPDGVAAARELAFHSWLAAQQDPAQPVELGPMPEASATVDDGEAATLAGLATGAGETRAETDDAPR